MAGQGRRRNAQAGSGSNDNNLITILSNQTAIQQQMLSTLEELKIATDMANGMGPSTPRNGRMPYRGPANVRPTVGDNQSQRPDILGRLGYGDGSAQHASGKGLQGIRNYVGNALESRYGASSGPSFTKRYDRAGNHIGYTAHHPDGSTTLHSTDEGGIDDSIARAGGRARASSLIGNSVERGAIGGAIRATPFVGEAALAYEGVEHAAKFVGNQRAANAPYQAIYGGSNISQLGQRAQGEGFKLGQLWTGGLTGAMSEQAYQGVSQLGVGQSQKSNDLNFITSNYKSMGMSVSDSLNLITTATKNLNESLTGLKGGLDAATQSAKVTGQSGVAVRQLYSQNYSTLASNNPGPAQGQAASVLTSVQASLGRNFAGVDFSGVLTSPSQTAKSAQTLGYSSPTALLGAEATNSSVSAGVIDSTMTRIFTPFATANVRNWLGSYLKSSGLNAASVANDASAQAAIADAMAQAGLGVNAYTLTAAAASAGVQLNQEQALQLFVKYLITGANGQSGIGATSAQAKVESSQKQQTTTSGAWQNTTNHASSAPASKPGLTKTTKNGVTTTVSDPVIADANKSLKGKNVIVMTAGGKRVVSIDEAIKNYPDQIAKGTAVVAETGQTVQQALGGETESDSYKGTDTTKIAAKGSAGKSTNTAGGMSLDDYQAKTNKKDSKSGGTVVISPSQQLLNLLTFSSTGNVSINTAAANGTTLQPGTGVGTGGN